MRWDPELGRRLGSAALLLILAGCGDVTVQTPTPDAGPTARQTPAPNTRGPTPSPTGGILAGALPAPGRPYDADDILDAMRRSRRPGGVPASVQTDAIARGVAAAIWTAGGQRWSAIGAGGSCGPARCTLDISGSHAGAAGDDQWSFEIIPAGGEVIVLDASLRSLPPDLPPALDRIARHELPAIDREDLVLAGVAWLPPPDDPGFVLSYRSGDEEGSCELELLLDGADGGVEIISQSGC